MNLILQGPSPDPSLVHHIASLIRVSKVIAISEQAYRCEGAHVNPELKATIEHLCLDAHMDATWIVPGIQLTDFKLLVMDMDSTLITIECIDEIADMYGLKPEVAAITEAAMRGELDFKESLTRRVALLKGLSASALKRVLKERLRLSPGASILLAAAKQADLKILLVSGGFTYFTEHLRKTLDLDYAHANTLDIRNDTLTGTLIGTIVDADEKKHTVERICNELGITPKQAIVMGDGANDLKMMSIAGLSVAVHAKPIVQAQAHIALNFVGLDGVLAVLAD